MYLMQTVSAVPRARTAVHMDARPTYVNTTGVDPNYYQKGYERRDVSFKPTKKEEFLNDRNIQKSAVEADTIRIENEEEEKEKKKEKKWTLGGFFRRKCRKDADDSDESENENRKGFLARRKSKRDRRKARGKSSANGFDIIIPQQKEAINGIGKTAEELWSGSPKTNHRIAEPINIDNTNNNCNGPTRYIYRHPGSPEALKAHISRHARRDSNLSRNSSGGSGSLDGRKGRKEVMARVEAKRDQMREESSSDENESYHSNSSLNKDGSRRSRRTDRHNKRLSRDEENLYLQERNVKSDFEGRKLPPHCRWISRNYYPDSSDHENLKFNLMNHSATPSPARSPRVRQKQIVQNMPNSYPVSTFPPGVHFQPTRAPPPPPNPNFHQKYINAKEAQIHGSQPQIYRNRNSEYIPQNIPRSNSEHSTNRKTLMDYEQFLSTCGSNREKSLSCDQDIHRASYFENNEIIHVQLPIGKPRVIQEVPNSKLNPNLSPRGARRISGMNYYDLPQHTLRPYNENGMICNRIDSTSSLPVQPGSYPYQQIPIVQRSASGNSFCNLYENSKEAYYNQNRSNSYQHIPTYINHSHIYQNYGQYRVNSAVPEPQVATVRYAQSGKPKSVFYWSQNETVSAKPTIIHNDAKDCPYPNRSPLPKPHPISSSNLRYYADQNPRSRNPIHIRCNTSPSPEQPYLSDSQIVKPQSVKDSITNASDFWKLKDQESMIKNLKKTPPSKPPLTVHNKPDRSRSSSPRPKELSKKWSENLNRKMQKEEYNVAKLNQLVKKNEDKNNNLDEALNELESIYKSLRLGDEDLIERAERRDMPSSRKQNGEVETENYSKEKVVENKEHQRAVPLRRSGVPDKVNDDMAYRRMNMKERTDTKKLAPPPTLSYLRSSPALSPIPGSSPILQKDTSSTEPDVTFDDVVFRNFRHANSTLKVQDPQPPFGIPIGPITPAPNSDYLHITPKERFRPTFMSSKTPDVIKDDLAFRNLRKDNMTANLPVVENNTSPTNELLTNPNFLLQKKRAVRSLSANLYSIMQKENHGFTPIETNNNNPLEKDCEKTQSLTDLTEGEGKNALEKRLKELKEEKNAKRAEFFELSKEQRKKEKSNLSWTELANLNGDFENVPQINTSTETLTEESESKKDQNLSRLRVNFQSEETKPERKFRSPIVELSKYPAAVPSSALYSNPFKEHTPGSPLDESQLEDLLSALAIEAKNASEDLGRQLVELELSTAPKPKPREESVEKEVKKKSRSSSVEKSSRRRSLSRSNSCEEKSSSEKRKEKRSRNNSIEKTTNEKRRKNSNHSENEVKVEEKAVEKIEEKSPERKKSESECESPKKRSRSNSLRNSSSPKDRKRSVSFEVVTDLSQILQDVEEQQNLNNEIVVEENKENKDVFQEVYEYNCKLLDLNPPKRKKSQPNEIIQVKEEVLQILEARGTNEVKEVKPNFETLISESADISSDIEKEFEKLHDEVDFQAKDKDPQERLDDLIADVTSVVNSSSESYSPRPFPNDDQNKSNGHLVSDRNGSSPSSSSGEGLGHA